MIERHNLKRDTFFIQQFFASMAKNLMIVNLGEFGGFAAIVISSLTGYSDVMNPDETVKITAYQASWLCKKLQFIDKKSRFAYFSRFLLQQVLRTWRIQSEAC